jgi:Domain of unknown function (DUF3883)
MRDISELLEFLMKKMSMAAIYQPAIILHLLTRDGFASRSELARTLSGYDDLALEHWDKILMKHPKPTLVDTHQILTYNKATRSFSLNFDLQDLQKVEEAVTVCCSKIEHWITKEKTENKLSESEILRCHRVLEIAGRGGKVTATEIPFQVEEFAMQVALQELQRLHTGCKVTLQPYTNSNFDILVGTSDCPVAYVKVKPTQALIPSFVISEAERQFSIEKSELYTLLIIYGINLDHEDYKVIFHHGVLDYQHFFLTPLQWKCRMIPK